MSPRVWLAVVLLSCATALHAEILTCRVVALSDGDTFTCLDSDKSQHKIRLANIDTPEKDQPYGAKAKQVLSSLIFSKQVEVEAQGTDRYGRTIGLVTVAGLNVMVCSIADFRSSDSVIQLGHPLGDAVVGRCHSWISNRTSLSSSEQ